MRKFAASNTYPFKHWLSSLLLGSLIILISDLVKGNNTVDDALGVAMLFFMFGFLFSLPVLVVYLLLYYTLVHLISSSILIKIVLNLVTTIGIFITIRCVGGSMMTIDLALYYSVIAVICSLIFRIKKREPANI
jgi:hypothetical protein